jgi:uncharacterized membrane protein YiaA
MSTTSAQPSQPFPTAAAPGQTGTTSPPQRRSQPERSAGCVPPPSGAWQGVSWFAFVLGATTFFYTAWYAPTVGATDRFFLYTAVLFSFFGSLSVSKSVRDRQEDVPITGLFYGLSWVAALTPFVLVVYYLTFYSDMEGSYRALLGMAYSLATFAVLAIAKNERDKTAAKLAD